MDGSGSGDPIRSTLLRILFVAVEFEVDCPRTVTAAFLGNAESWNRCLATVTHPLFSLYIPIMSAPSRSFFIRNPQQTRPASLPQLQFGPSPGHQTHGANPLHGWNPVDSDLPGADQGPYDPYGLLGPFGDDTQIPTQNCPTSVEREQALPEELSRKRNQHEQIVKNPEAAKYQRTSQVPPQQLPITNTGDSVSRPDAACREHQVVPVWHPPMLKPDQHHPVSLQPQGLLNTSAEPTWFPSVMKIGEKHGAFAKDPFTGYWLTELKGCTSHAILQNALAQSTPTSQWALARILRVLGSESLVRKAEDELKLRLSGNNAQVELGLGLVVGCPSTLEDDLQWAIAEALEHADLWPLFVPHVNEDDQAVNVHNPIVVQALQGMIGRLMAL